MAHQHIIGHFSAMPSLEESDFKIQGLPRLRNNPEWGEMLAKLSAVI